jgi:integrase
MANVYKTVLQSIFKLAKRKGERNDIPTEGIEDFTEAKRTRYITDDELRAIRGAAMVGKDGKMTPSGPMAQTMMDLCYLTAQRIDDILNLKKTDVSDDGIFFHPAKTVNSTGIKIRIQMSDAIRQALNRIRNYGQEGVTSLYVIHTLEGQPCTYWWARSAWDRAVERSGVTNPEGTHIHDLKAKALTDAKKAGQNAQALGGHADPRMTEHYIKNRIVLDVEPVKSRIFEA